jgi:hypothetical protein
MRARRIAVHTLLRQKHVCVVPTTLSSVLAVPGSLLSTNNTVNAAN